jgi:Ring finger domain
MHSSMSGNVHSSAPPAKRRCLRNSEKLKAQDAYQCAICIRDGEDADLHRLPCGHSFHRDCIQRWLHVCPNCPLCRACTMGHCIPEPSSSPARSLHQVKVYTTVMNLHGILDVESNVTFECVVQRIKEELPLCDNEPIWLYVLVPARAGGPYTEWDHAVMGNLECEVQGSDCVDAEGVAHVGLFAYIR